MGLIIKPAASFCTVTGPPPSAAAAPKPSTLGVHDAMDWAGIADRQRGSEVLLNSGQVPIRGRGLSPPKYGEGLPQAASTIRLDKLDLSTTSSRDAKDFSKA